MFNTCPNELDDVQFVQPTLCDKTIEKYPLVSFERYDNYVETSIGNLAMIAGYSKTLLSPSENLTYEYEISGYKIEYSIERNNYNYLLSGFLKSISSKETLIDNIEISNCV